MHGTHPAHHLGLGFVLLATGCELRFDEEDSPSSYMVSVAEVRRPASIAVSRIRETPKVCALESQSSNGPFNPPIPKMSCVETRSLDARITKLECLPSNACSAVRMDGARGDFVPVHEELSLLVEVDFEGVVESRTVPIKTRPIQGQLVVVPGDTAVSNAAAAESFYGPPCFVGGAVQVCWFEPSGVGADVEVYGADNVLLSPRSSLTGCTVVVPSGVGALVARAYAPGTSRRLAEQLLPIHGFESVTNVEPDSPLVATTDDGGKRYRLEYTLSAISPDGRGFLPGSVSKLSVDVPVRSDTSPSSRTVHVEFPKPGVAPVVVASLGARTFSFPVTLGAP